MALLRTQCTLVLMFAVMAICPMALGQETATTPAAVAVVDDDV